MYKYAGSFLEEVTKLCFKEKFPEAKTAKIPNLYGKKPQKYEIDCLIDKKAIEIKWRDATTDGDHINKEHDRIRTIHETGLIPIRIMFYYPNREQAKKHQRLLETLYKGLGGEYYHSDNAWDYIFQMTSVRLKDILQDIAHDKTL